MTLKKHIVRWLCITLAAAVLAGCASHGQRALVQERGVAAKKSSAAHSSQETSATIKSAPSDSDWRPRVYVVQKGDTLYSIAFNHGMGYREIAQLNNIQNPDMIHIGQEIRLFPASAATASAPAPEIKPVLQSKPQEPPIKDQPLAIKLPYSAQAVAQIAKMQEEPVNVAKVEAKAEIKPVEAKAEIKPDESVSATDDGDETAIEWSMPTSGKLVGEFSESANRKGIDIAGKRGQAVLAGATGKVVYSGNGLRGYGKLVIIKHNKTYLSAYAHNDHVLVKEGQSVAKGQKIAEMGNTDADQVKLHFEIRKFGKPVDPAKYLPL